MRRFLSLILCICFFTLLSNAQTVLIKEDVESCNMGGRMAKTSQENDNNYWLAQREPLAGAAEAIVADEKTQEIKLTKDNVDKIVAAMTQEEKVRLVVGMGEALYTDVDNTTNLVPGSVGATAKIARLGIKPTVLTDGPAGLRISPTRKGETRTYYSTGFPIGTALASSWNTELIRKVGETIGNEAKEYGVDVLLAPGMNIHRDPLCGRNFEYYSEDPLVTGKMAAAFVKGVQSNGVGTSVKHFAANSQETNRKDLDTRLSQRALREIYLRGFEIAVREAEPWTVMSAYNMINGEQCMESRNLLTTILRDEWGFKGFVLSDWASPGWRDSAKEIYAGNDLLTPGSQQQQDEILAALKDGTLSEKDLDVCVTRILNYVVKTKRFSGYKYSDNPDLKAHAKTAVDAATESIVLLKNDSATLPFHGNIRKIGLFGICSYDLIAGGTGSGNVSKAYVISLPDGLRNTGYEINKEVSGFYENAKTKPAFDQAETMGQVALTETEISHDLIVRSAQTDDMAILTIGRNCGEGADRHLDGDFNLTDIEHKLIEDVCTEYHKAGKKVTVIMNVSGVIETASWKEKPDAILLAWQLGQESGNAIADILSGKATPSGKLTMTFPIKYEDCNTFENFPYDYTGPKAMGNYPKIPRPARKNIHYVNFDEDIYVGYRYFNTHNLPVSYPFGFGLSYTQFRYSNPEIRKTGENYVASVTVINTGKVSGKEAVQVYAAAPLCAEGKPSQQLIAFGKTGELAPGESQRVEMNFTERELARFDEQLSAWVLDSGTYGIQLASSSRTIMQTLSLEIKENSILLKVNDVLGKK